MFCPCVDICLIGGPGWLQEMIESSFWLMKWPRNLCGFLSLYGMDVNFFLVSASPN